MPAAAAAAAVGAQQPLDDASVRAAALALSDPCLAVQHFASAGLQGLGGIKKWPVSVLEELSGAAKAPVKKIPYLEAVSPSTLVNHGMLTHFLRRKVGQQEANRWKANDRYLYKCSLPVNPVGPTVRGSIVHPSQGRAGSTPPAVLLGRPHAARVLAVSYR